MSNLTMETHKCTLQKEDDIEIIEGGKKKGLLATLKRKWKSFVVLSINHPLCSTYFKSETTVLEEKRRQLNSKHPYIIHPLSKLRIWYETYLVILYGAALFANPLEAAYANQSREKFNRFFLTLQSTIDILCLLDVIINFFTGYMVKRTRTIEISPKKIAKNYLTGFFLFDFVSSIPRYATYSIFPPPCPPKPILGILSIFRLLKLPRLFSLKSMVKRVAFHLKIKSNTAVRIASATFVLGNTIHFFSCFQTTMPRIFNAYFSSSEHKLAWMYNYGINNLSISYKYIFSSFRGTAYVLGIRIYRMFHMKIVTDYITSIFTFFVGKIFMGVFWIVFSSAILNSRMMDIKYNEIMNQLNEYMRQKQLPQNLRDRLQQYYRFKYQNKYLKETLITSLLSDNLKKEVSIHMCKSFISKVNLFSELTKDQINQIIPKLVSEIFLPTDMIIQSGMDGHSMYFISSGTVAVYTHSGKEIGHLTDGAYFGEISMVLKGQMRVTTVIAVEITQVFRLDKKDFNKVLLKNKAIFKNIVACAERRLQEAIELEESYKKMLFEKEHTVGNVQDA